MDSFHEHFDQFFTLVVHLTASAEVRIARVHQREYEEFGNRALEGVDMHEANQRFLYDIASCDFGGGSTSLEVHTKWAESLQRQVLRLDGSDDLSNNLRFIVEEYRTVCLL